MSLQEMASSSVDVEFMADMVKKHVPQSIRFSKMHCSTAISSVAQGPVIAVGATTGGVGTVGEGATGATSSQLLAHPRASRAQFIPVLNTS